MAATNFVINSKNRRLELLQSGRLADCEFAVLIAPTNIAPEINDKKSGSNTEDAGADLKYDITSKNDDNYKIFKCHKMILTMTSEVFERMFAFDESANSDENGINRIYVDDVSAANFELFIKYIYIYQLEVDHLPTPAFHALFYLGNKYMMEDFSSACRAVLSKRAWSNEDILPMYELSYLYDDLALTMLCGNKIRASALSLLSTKSFYALKFSNLKRLVFQLLQNPQVKTASISSALNRYVNENNVSVEDSDMGKLILAVSLYF